MTIAKQVYEFINPDGVQMRWELPGMPEFQHSDLHGVALFCGHCGRIWGRKFEEFDGVRPDYWVIETTDCSRHGNGSMVNGLMEFGYFLSKGKDVPRAFLVHEFLAHTKGENRCNSSRSLTPSATSSSSPSTEAAVNSPCSSPETLAGSSDSTTAN